MARRKKSNGIKGVYSLSSASALFFKAERERRRFNEAASIDDKIDHFLNFCVALTASFDYFKQEATSQFQVHEKTTGLARLASMSKSEPLLLARKLANSFKHGGNDDLKLLRSTEILVSENKTIIDKNNLDLSKPELFRHLEADGVNIHVENDKASIISSRISLELVDGRKVDAWLAMGLGLQVLRAVYDVLYKKDGVGAS